MKENKTILVVDDDKSVRDFVVYALRTMEYNTLMAEDGKEALQIISSNTDIDLIITDLVMPYNGIKLIENLKELKIDIPFIIMSGEYKENLAEMCMKLGGADYLEKPFQVLELKTTVENVLSKF